MFHLLYSADLIIVLHTLIWVLVALRIIWMKPPTGTALAWMFLVAAFPIVGTVLYLLIGERRISAARSRKFSTLRQVRTKVWDEAVVQRSPKIDLSGHDAVDRAMIQLGVTLDASPTVADNGFQLFDSFDKVIPQMVKDIDSAKVSLLMEFYIWQDAGQVGDVLNAMEAAVKRGVDVRLLVDAIGSHPWLKTAEPDRLRAAGVKVVVALPVGLIRNFIGRADLRLHRKVVVVDDRIAWTGSMNMVDPKFFKQNSGVGEWIDAMVRLEGPVIMPMAATVVSDWAQENPQDKNYPLHALEKMNPAPSGEVDIQVFPSGPSESGDGLQLMLLSMISSARERLIITTPYFAPDDVIIKNLRAAAGRGVKISIIMPERIDSLMTRYASRSYYDDLYSMGIDIYLFRDGLLHTKSITVDGTISMFGSVNIDYRSLWLNYEIALFIYDKSFTQQLTNLQEKYMARCDKLVPAQWEKRPKHEIFLEDVFRLLAPLL